MSNKWDNDYFVRVPKEMFNDMVWNSKPFSKSKAYAHLYSMAHDGRNSTIIETEKGDVFKLNPGEVCRGLRTLANIFGWGKDPASIKAEEPETDEDKDDIEDDIEDDVEKKNNLNMREHEEVNDFIDSLTDTHFQKISSFFDTMPILKHDIHLKCTKKKKDKICSYKETITLSGLQSFFV